MLAVLAAYALAYVFYLAVCWISVLIGLVAPSPETVQGISFIFIMPLVFGSSILLPNTRTHARLAAGLGQGQPGHPPGRRGARADRRRPGGHHVLYTLAWAAGIVLVAFPLAMRMYRRRL